MSRFRRWLIKTAHLVHVYVTLFGLALILFFAVTGFMLNHIEWFEMERVHTVSRPLPLDKLPNKKLPEPDASGEATGDDKLAIVEALRKEFGLPGELTSFSFAGETDDDGNTRKFIKVEFKRAGEITEAKIDRDTGVAAVEYKSQGWMAVTTDLHRGNRGNRTNETKFTGQVWSVVIDGTCALLVIVCTTGFFLWWSLKGRGQYGALFALGGTATAGALYYWFVP